MSERWRCTECESEAEAERVNVTVTRSDGTREGRQMYVCALCLGLETTLVRLCDHDGCREIASCGTPTKDGYVSSCYRHAPREGGRG